MIKLITASWGMRTLIPLKRKGFVPTVYVKIKGHSRGVSFYFGAEGGIRTLVWCYPQTDFESAPLWPLRYLCIYDAIVCIIYAEPCEKWLKSAALESASHIPTKRVKLACKRKVWIYSPQVKYLSVMQLYTFWQTGRIAFMQPSDTRLDAYCTMVL